MMKNMLNHYKIINVLIKNMSWLNWLNWFTIKQNFTLSHSKEPHMSRRKIILDKHPEIKQLYGIDPLLSMKLVGLTLCQLSLSILTRKIYNSWHWWLSVYILGGTITHALSLGNHELTHNLAFETPIYNESLGIFINIAQGIPSAITFKKYHLEHHYYQGIQNVDVDIPTIWEGMTFNDPLKKLLWIILQPLFYAIRPLIVNPKPMLFMEFINIVIVLGFDLLLVYWDYRVLLFNILSTLLGMGLHPVAGHFISEHYEFSPNQETYSYYGSLNLLTFNVGYHNEHHDFPKIPGSRLPQVKEIAKEYYDNLSWYDSWIKVIWNYIFRIDISPFSRIVRN